MDPPHIITGRENSDGYFKDKVYLLQEQQRENNDGKAWMRVLIQKQIQKLALAVL